MRILKVEPGKAPYVKDMKDGLEAIQQEVQGLFQPVYVEDGVILCCNEEGKLNGMKPNRWLEDDIICGPFFLVGDDHEGGFCSLTDEQLDRYTQRFREPEQASFSLCSFRLPVRRPDVSHWPAHRPDPLPAKRSCCYTESGLPEPERSDG